MSTPVPEFAPATVTAAAARALGCAAGEARHVPKGFANENWHVETERGPVLVKIGRTGADAGKWRASERAPDLARAAGVPAPELLYAETACAVLGGRVLRIQRWLPGVSPVTLVPVAATRFWTTLGDRVRRLHDVAFAQFSSRLDDSAPDFPTWSAYLAWRVPQIEGRCADAGVLDADRRERLWRELAALARTVDDVVRPAFTHRDLHPDNLLASPDGELAGLLDFDMAEPWDPVADWFKLEWWCFADVPERRLAFEAGYGDPRTRHAHFDRRRRIVDVLESTNLAANAALAGDASSVARSLARLDRTGLP